MKRIKTTLNTKTNRYKNNNNHQRHLIAVYGNDLFQYFLSRGHKQMSGNTVKKCQTDQEKARTHKTHNHISEGRHIGSSLLLDHNQTAGSNCINFDKNICREKVISIDQRKK